jgi:hypothetical protein
MLRNGKGRSSGVEFSRVIGLSIAVRRPVLTDSAVLSCDYEWSERCNVTRRRIEWGDLIQRIAMVLIHGLVPPFDTSCNRGVGWKRRALMPPRRVAKAALPAPSALTQRDALP